MDTVKNAKSLPEIYYGRHMAEGVAEYREPNKDPYRIFVGESTIKNMDPTFAGKPVYVDHVDGVDLANLQNEADGYVVESFFNKFDGKHWVKFIAVSDRAKEAIRKGWKLSNAYIIKDAVGGGLWHGVEYAQEVKRGEYEHLAIVPNPRYEESVIMTPAEFKRYNGDKEEELKRLTNSKKGEKGMFKFFKREKVENSADFENMVVELPKSKKEVVLSRLINEMDEAELKNMSEEPVMANGDHMVELGEGKKMSVNQLVEEYQNMCKKNMDDEEAKKKALELAAHEEEEMKGKKENEGEEEKKENEEDKPEEKKSNSTDKAHFDALKNANKVATKSKVENRLDLIDDQVRRGKKRYGSN